MASAYPVTRRQEHLEGKYSRQLRHLQTGVTNSLDETILNRSPGTCKMTGIVFCFVK